MTDLVLHDLADGSLLADYPGLSDSEASARAVAAAGVLEREKPRGLLAAVPGARSLFVEFDPIVTDSTRLLPLLAGPKKSEGPEAHRTLRIPVAYGAQAGADLAEVARAAGLSAEEFAGRHARASYRVGFLGFAPGFAYLTGLPADLHCPRLSTPRTRVPPGAVAIGGPYTGIYPGETPGGWRLIGRTNVRLFDPHADSPALFSPGDRVVFEQVDRLDPSPSTTDPMVPSPDPATGPPLFRVLSPGVLSSLQGGPRYGWSRWGVPPGGAMDARSLAVGNQRLANAPDAPALEMTLVGPELEVLATATICVGGASPQVELNGRAISIGEPVAVTTGDRLKVGRILGGARSYLCVERGFGMSERPHVSPRVEKDRMLRLPVGQAAAVPASSRSRAVDATRPPADPAVVRVVLGPHSDHYTREGLATLLSSVYRVSASSDRRGIRLEGPPIGQLRSSDIPPEGTPLGGIQVAGDGMPIVLGPDRPVTGGYARIATVIHADFGVLAQGIPGSAVRFAAVDLAGALAARVG